MPNIEAIQKKKETVSEVKDRISNCPLTVFASYSGLKVSEMTNIRRALRPGGYEMTVYKNNVARFALREMSIDFNPELLVGPTAVITGGDDSVTLSKTLVKFAKESEVFNIRGGVFQNSIVDLSLIESLAKLPTKDELIAKVVGGIKAPITNLVLGLSSPLRGLINVLNAIQDQKK